jgi:hypothetical protein
MRHTLSAVTQSAPLNKINNKTTKHKRILSGNNSDIKAPLGNSSANKQKKHRTNM